MTELIHISCIEKYLKNVMNYRDNKIEEIIYDIQKINSNCPNCKDNISEPESSFKGIEDSYYSDKYNLLFCGKNCEILYNDKVCNICNDNLTVVNCDICNLRLCEKCHKTNDNYSWYCVKCYLIKENNDTSDSDNNTSDSDDSDDSDSD